MKRSLLLVALLLGSAVLGSAGTVYNNFNGYSDYWHPLGYPNTATYGELFSAPTNGDNTLTGLTFYMGNPYVEGDIIMTAYLATWTGTHAGTLLGHSDPFTYANTGQTSIPFTVTPGITLTGGAEYVLFLSISESYGQSFGETYISQGLNTIPGGGFVYYNNGGDFNALFTNSWDATGLSPQWAMEIDFGPGTPEPGTLMLMGTGLLGGLGMLRRKLF